MRTLRVLAILTKRQMADDGPLLGAAFVGAVGFLLALGLPAFLPLQNSLPYVVGLLVALPFLLGAGSFFLGVAQVRGNENRGIPALPSVSVAPGEASLACMITGTIYVITIVGGLELAIAGAGVRGLVQGPQSLVPRGLVDLFVALLLIALACYCVGFATGRRGSGRSAFLGILTLVLLFISATIVKGLGLPLALVLVPFLAVFWAYLWMSVSHPRWATVPLGFVALTLFVVPLFWLRYSSDVITALVMHENSNDATLFMHDDLHFRSRPDPQVAAPLTICGRMDADHFPAGDGRIHFLLRPLGIVSYLQARLPDSRPTDLSPSGHSLGIYYEEDSGLFSNRRTPDIVYAGPEGMAQKPNDKLGRFQSPVICRINSRRPIVFDRQSRFFYAINFAARQVDQGPHLADTVFQPVDAIASRLGARACWVDYSHSWSRGRRVPYTVDYGSRHVPVVDQSGAIGILDVKTWKWFPGAGHLPRPRTFFGRGSRRPSDLFGYAAEVIIKEPEEEYVGLVSASLSRQGAPMTIAVFSKEGRLLRESDSRGRLGLCLLFTGKYLVESLHPPVLTLASFFTAYSFEAGSTHRALFLMPNSLVALQRDRETRFILQFLFALLFLLPALAFAGFLSWRVVRDAAVMGLSRRARGLWGLATLAFGLPAYITYRMVRPKAALALCSECGRGRRVDQETCHHCGREWKEPIRNPPAWRVVSP